MLKKGKHAKGKRKVQVEVEVKANRIISIITGIMKPNVNIVVSMINTISMKGIRNMTNMIDMISTIKRKIGKLI